MLVRPVGFIIRTDHDARSYTAWSEFLEFTKCSLLTKQNL